MYNKIVEICNRLEREKSNSVRFGLTQSFDALFRLLTEEEQEKISKEYSHIFFHDKEYEVQDCLMDNYDIHSNCCFKIEERFKKLDFKYYNMFSNNKVSYKEIIENCFDILDSMGSEYSDILEEVLTKQNVYKTNFDSYDGLCINLVGINDSLVFLRNKISNNSSCITTLVHEIGHAYENKFMSAMNINQQLNRYYDIFSEVISMFFERVAIDYNIKNHIYIDDFNCILNENYMGMFTDFDELSVLVRLISEDKIIHDLEGKYFSKAKEFEVPSNYFKTEYGALSGDYFNPLRYGYGTLIAEYFFNIYREDKKEGLKVLKNFLSNQSLLSDRDMFSNIGLIDSDFKFLDKGVNENINYMKRRYKW